MADKVIWQLPFASTAIENGPEVVMDSAGTLSIRFTNEEGSNAKIQFRQVLAFAFTSFEFCTEEMLDAYDEVVLLSKSKLVRKFRRMKRGFDGGAGHYRLFLDEIGCYEVVAASCEGEH